MLCGLNQILPVPIEGVGKIIALFNCRAKDSGVFLVQRLSLLALRRAIAIAFAVMVASRVWSMEANLDSGVECDSFCCRLCKEIYSSMAPGAEVSRAKCVRNRMRQ